MLTPETSMTINTITYKENSVFVPLRSLLGHDHQYILLWLNIIENHLLKCTYSSLYTGLNWIKCFATRGTYCFFFVAVSMKNWWNNSFPIIYVWGRFRLSYKKGLIQHSLNNCLNESRIFSYLYKAYLPTCNDISGNRNIQHD